MGSIGFDDPSGLESQQRVAAAPVARPRALAGTLLESDTAVVLSVAVAACLLHFVASGRYGFFRDELYYAACGEHLAWGYVDHAPLIAVIARLTRALLGDSLFALRFFPALAGGAKVLLAGWMARELGGRRFAQFLAAIAVLLAPVYLTFDNFLSMNAFEPVFWMACAAIVMRIVKTGKQRLWLLFGLIAGLGVLNKHSMLFFGLGIFVGLLLTPERRLLRNKWIWLGGLVAFLIFLPNIAWEARNGWPTLEILRIVGKFKNTQVTALSFILQQTLLTQPVATPIWLAGLYFFLRTDNGKAYRLLGWSYLVVLTEMLILKGKIYYLAPVYPMLFAAGAVWMEARIRQRKWNWLKPALVSALMISGLVVAPLALPLLPVDAMVRYCKFWGVAGVRVENHDLGKLPQLFADMFGWEDQVSTVAGVYRSLPVQERAKCAILASNYGEAGAIDYFGPAYGLPKAISNHNSYYLWGPRGYWGEVVITVGLTAEDLQPLFNDIEKATTVSNEYAMPDENNIPLYICRKPKKSLQEAWPQLKLYN